ncbi:single-stranded-DNA-specific exonuclease RecJ [Sulfurihydrogenibium sp.]|jgi:single-stranded-DNA-specific exonuclease|uniref:single-stranded-DNA-specific exonuclease RecJ n=1 Tax=Sulfurihydrogenibium sp. TaxID=2053621 RepID=UPI00260AFB7F|nr:single-stranded-DNA-specific exonuclease RecJ [Sulfurihydrogenibium sp.]
MEVGISGYQWIDLSKTNPAPDFLVKKYGKIFAQVLYNRRDLFDKDFSQDYILPELKNLVNPSYFYSLEEIALKLAEHIKRKTPIVVYGDYDADGITSTSLLINFFRDLGVNAKYYIPSRFSEGYGLNKEAIKKLSQHGKVLIVCDSGTNAFDELFYAKSLGFEVFVLDHHEPSHLWQNYTPPFLSEKINIINPKFYSDKLINPLFKHLATVGIAFYLIAIIRRLLNIDIKLRDYLDIVAIGTVADVVPMSFINRVMVKIGLEELNKQKRAGIKELLNVARVKKELTSQDIGFIIGPRINASGRLADARNSVKLLITRDQSRANVLAIELENLNKKRQRLTDNVISEAEKELQKQDLKNVIVIGKEGWHSGVVGIAAGKLTEKYKLPSVILSVNNGKAVGSARSVSKVNIYKALDKCRDLFDKFGGHSMAAGMSLKTNLIPELKERLNQAVEEVAEEKPWAVKEIDMEVPMSYWTTEKVKEIYTLQPFGEKNPIPKFLARNLKIEFFTNPAKNLLILNLKDENKNIFNAKSWKAKELLDKLSVGMVIDIVYTPEINYYKGFENLDFVIDDLKIVK